MFHRAFTICAAASLAHAAFAQSVVSAHSGVVHYFEGAVQVDGQPLQQKFGKFVSLKPGSDLRTDNGRAEILLTPGVFLRVDQNSSIKMVATRLTDTRVEFVGGSALLDSSKAEANGDPVGLTYRTFEVKFKKPGRYRFDSVPPALKVEEGEAEVTLRGKSIVADAAETVPFTATLVKHADRAASTDALETWSKDRSDAIAANDESATASDKLTAKLNDPQNDAYSDPYSAYVDPYAVYGAIDPSLLAPSLMLASPSLTPGLGIPWLLYPSPIFRSAYVPLYQRLPIYRPLGSRPGMAYRPLITPSTGRYPSSVGSRPVGGGMRPHPVMGRR